MLLYKWSILLLLPCLFNQQPGYRLVNKITTGNSFTEGIILIKTSFPGLTIDKLINKIDFTAGNIGTQYNQLKDSLNFKPLEEDAMFMSELFATPVYSTLYFSKSRSLLRAYSLGSVIENYVDENDKSGHFSLRSHLGDDQITIKYPAVSIHKVWEKYRINDEEFNPVISNEVSTIAGYPCKKITYNFTGTLRQSLPTRVISAGIPWKITVWYTDALDPAINIHQPFYFNLNKAILKTVVEFDKDSKKKMIHEVFKIEAKELSDEDFKVSEHTPSFNYPKEEREALSTLILTVGAIMQRL
jgi:hypothetical protein